MTKTKEETQTRVLIYSEPLDIRHEFFMPTSRDEAVQALKNSMSNLDEPLFHITSDECDYLYPKEWLLLNTIFVVDEASENGGKPIPEPTKDGNVFYLNFEK